MNDDPHVFIARTPEEHAEFQRRASDLATYGGVALQLVRDPDNPQGVAASVSVARDGSPCLIAVAMALGDVAAHLIELHDEGPCGP